ncbi:hypothetical protein MKK68_03540 [Methylobacterium sp. E-016]|uniref:hypothetical protein n=1 Tax=Methylobacterium sp. E-016 TaxID=2836556 RepID=UPI001FB9E83F|nr:hypothetical protein [Methylobacterium sp. E-016]MCJ2074727.1 hypothetical protein [Methylobacterium sp. E-016]
MRDEVAVAASSTAASLKRRVIILPALDTAIAQAVVRRALSRTALVLGGTTTTQTRAAALASLEVVIEHLRTVEASEDTRALGLGWRVPCITLTGLEARFKTVGLRWLNHGNVFTCVNIAI